MIRDYTPADAAAVRAIYQGQGLDYQFPDLDSPLFLVKKVQEVDGVVVGALMLRLTAETFLFVDGPPQQKMAAMVELQPAVLREAYEKGLDDMMCVVPGTVLSRFRKRLGQLGWQKDREGWTLFSRKVTA